ncbi:MAG: response regulator [Chthoniobacterales bacterium]|nr:response regulator [Chthoniobacterales bacterium]
MKNHKPKILIVDDEEGFTKVTRLTLTDYEIREENNSARALETARSFQPDLILLDVMMPEFDGGDVAAQIRADPKLKRVPIVFLTAIVTERETAMRPLLGGYPFISKPVTPERLAESIERHLHPDD